MGAKQFQAVIVLPHRFAHCSVPNHAIHTEDRRHVKCIDRCAEKKRSAIRRPSLLAFNGSAKRSSQATLDPS
ncbi:hypothetical protein Mal15_06740 [Stieleria maiorica]|uniref:Uncharacterized protein n=1 Tax=Stieleria maiorica TaxID=2795974 RepID=A0A5B9M8Y9_9BACT|nr:hypothetical protein Mal15_06740 [Stieleria maiorica]